MGISSITSLAVARNLREPTKRDAGVAALKEGTDDQASPTLPDILAKTVPVGLVSAYTAFIAVVAETVAEPTPEQPEPDQHLLIRWLALAALVLFAALLTYFSYRSKAGQDARQPVLEVTAVTVAAAAWGLGVPESPLLATVDRQDGLLLLALIGFLGVGTNAVLATLMKKKQG